MLATLWNNFKHGEYLMEKKEKVIYDYKQCHLTLQH